MTTSQNGWPANDITLTKVWDIPGTERRIRLEKGDAGFILVDFFAWFDEVIERIDEGQLDDWGYAERPIRGSTTTLSNHASGTAGDMNALKHGLGLVGTFEPWQVILIRAKLKEYDGCIRWGGDYAGRKDEMHFEINRNKTAVKVVADRIRSEEMAVEAKVDQILSLVRSLDMDIRSSLNALHEKIDPIHRLATISLDYRAHHGADADDLLGHVLSVRKALMQHVSEY